MPFKPSNLRRVIFGMRMKTEVKNRLLSLLDQDAFKPGWARPNRSQSKCRCLINGPNIGRKGVQIRVKTGSWSNTLLPAGNRRSLGRKS